MKNIIFILLFPIFCNAQINANFYNTLPRSIPYVASNVKSTALIDGIVDSNYEAFGPVVNTSPILGARATRLTMLCRVGTDHLGKGYAKYVNYDVASGTWGGWQTYDDAPPPDHRDTWGGRLDYGGNGSGDSVIIFGQQTWNNTGGHSWRSLDLYYYKFDLNFNFAPKRSIFTGNPTVEQLFRGEVFGAPSAGDSPGEYYIMLFQWDSLSTRFKVDCLHTTDYFNHITALNITDGSPQWSEGAVNYLGNGKLVAFLRNDVGGKLDVSYSSNYGATWSYPTYSNLGYYGLGVKIPYSYKYKGKYNIIFQDRDAYTICISRDNDTASFFNHTQGFNPQEIWAQNAATTTLGISGLGYPSMACIDTTNDIFVNAWAHEYTGSEANIQYTRSKINYNPTLPDPPPVMQVGFVTSTSFRVDMMSITNTLIVPGGYTYPQMENISYFLCDVATDAGFTVFPVIRWGYVIDPPSQVHNLRIPATWLSLNNLTPNTTYYVRIKAVNFLGQSTYTTISQTTNP